MTISLYAILLVILICLMDLRQRVITQSIKDWNYYVYRYKNYCRINYTEAEKPMCRIDENEVTRAEAIMVFLMFWKIDSDYFWDYKPDWEEIHEIYILKK